MNLAKMLPVIKAVLLNPYVIGAAVVVILYCNFVSYIVRYKKKPPKPKHKKIVEAAPSPAKEGENAEDGEASAEDGGEAEA
ncbi:MAG: hypothetical protein KBS84_06975 [Treponema sp.]|nr:hypothetical protein [Candidatus Treponema scatequi]